MRKKNIARILSVMTVTSFFIILAGIAEAAGITNSKHDLSSSNTTAGAIHAAVGGTGADQLCSFCHTPHFGTSTTLNLPLWNRATTTSGYQMYTSATIDMVTAAQPQGVSAACLSCHDGVLALDQLVNKPGSGLAPTGGTALTINGVAGYKLTATNNTASSATFLSQDLRNDHPISITYLTSGTVPPGGFDAKFNAAVNGKVGLAGLPLYGPSKNQVECGTCHNVHDPAVVPFLRASNAGSALCLACHIT